MKKALVLLSISLFSLSSQANYFKGGVGYAIGGEVESDTVSLDLDNQFLSPLLVAYGIEMYDNLHVELEAAYRMNEYDVSGNTVDPKVFTFGVNLAGAFPVSDAVSLAGGIGLTYGKYGDFETGGHDDETLGAQVFAGADFKVQDNITLGGELRYFTTMSDFESSPGTDVSYQQTALMFNAKFSL